MKIFKEIKVVPGGIEDITSFKLELADDVDDIAYDEEEYEVEVYVIYHGLSIGSGYLTYRDGKLVSLILSMSADDEDMDIFTQMAYEITYGQDAYINQMVEWDGQPVLHMDEELIDLFALESRLESVI